MRPPTAGAKQSIALLPLIPIAILATLGCRQAAIDTDAVTRAIGREVGTTIVLARNTGTAVEPTCSSRTTSGPSAAARRRISSWARPAQAGSGSTIRIAGSSSGTTGSVPSAAVLYDDDADLSLLDGKTVVGTPIRKPAPVFAKLDESVVDEELARAAGA